MNVRACRSVSYPPALAWRLLLSSLILAVGMIADAWLSRRGAPAAAIGVELACLGLAAALIAPAARVRWLPWVTAGMVGATMLALRLSGAPPEPTGSLVLAMILSALSPSAAVGLVATGLLVASEAIAALL